MGRLWLLGCAAASLLLLLLHAALRRPRAPSPLPLAHPHPAAPAALLHALSLRGCGRVFIDGGAHRGEAVGRFLSGGFYGCALAAPDRVYPRRWASLGAAPRRQLMLPLREGRSFCIRSFEAAPELLPALRVEEARLRRRGVDARFVDGALANRTARAAPRLVVRYGRRQSAASATTLRFADVHAEGRPRALSERTVLGASYSLRDVVAHVVEMNRSAVLAVRLDVEGAEWWALSDLVADGALLCQVSYLFVEFHGSATAAQRAKLPSYGLREDLFDFLKNRTHELMERPGCRLKLYWRSFWASCGDEQRFIWRDSADASSSL
ncbi:hypothetical protein AB1Y20_010215 [Prymnesium parvum]|uniref:Methyltransferase FkbM domain-containing protein n=1 Tax=Prymnesium parvum TaxID=97485 RepID=A0AB34K6J9_PRYPA